jgi:uncharacterized repeat protein (TIGR03803 family)
VNPAGPLTEVDGVLYGTTLKGGKYHKGLVFSLSPNGVETALHDFSGADGCNPSFGVTAVNQTLYGVTTRCGYFDAGTAFAMDLLGNTKVLYSFGQTSTVPAFPSGGLIYANNLLYGPSMLGGPNNYGTVYGLTTSGVPKLVYIFSSPAAGYPANPLTAINNTLYGTTGALGVMQGGIFSLGPSSEHLLFSFDGADGVNPSSSLIHYGAALYGTTATGGAYGYGTVYTISP